MIDLFHEDNISRLHSHKLFIETAEFIVEKNLVCKIFVLFYEHFMQLLVNRFI